MPKAHLYTNGCFHNIIEVIKGWQLLDHKILPASPHNDQHLLADGPRLIDRGAHTANTIELVGFAETDLTAMVGPEVSASALLLDTGLLSQLRRDIEDIL
ncbi:hypothetical protein P7K49_029026, partial [Saguinus oedipus]